MKVAHRGSVLLPCEHMGQCLEVTHLMCSPPDQTKGGSDFTWDHLVKDRKSLTPRVVPLPHNSPLYSPLCLAAHHGCAMLKRGQKQCARVQVPQSARSKAACTTTRGNTHADPRHPSAPVSRIATAGPAAFHWLGRHPSTAETAVLCLEVVKGVEYHTIVNRGFFFRHSPPLSAELGVHAAGQVLHRSAHTLTAPLMSAVERISCSTSAPICVHEACWSQDHTRGARLPRSVRSRHEQVKE